MDRLSSGISLQTFGCKVNTYDTGLMSSRLESAGLTVTKGDSAPQGGIHVLNTCAVTAEATRQALSEARRIKRRDPLAKVVVTGCSAQVDTEKFSDLPEVDLIVANSHKGDLTDLLRRLQAGENFARVHKSNIFRKEDLEGGGGQEMHHTRSFLKIQDGCDSFCTFCVIPFARGKSRSLSVDALATRIRELEGQGVKEVVLTGVHIGDYKCDSGAELGDLVSSLLRRTSIPRLRLSSLEPIELSERLCDQFANPRLCRHFHMSIQSASTSVLQRMKRKYGALEVRQALELIGQRWPDAYVGMDVIAGFPEESDAEFNETLALLKDVPWTRLHVFPYSARPLTYAARAYHPVPASKVRDRAQALREISRDRHAQSALHQIGSTKKILLLKSRIDQKRGIGRDYWPVLIPAEAGGEVGEEITVQIRGCDRQESRTGELSLYALDTPQNRL